MNNLLHPLVEVCQVIVRTSGQAVVMVGIILAMQWLLKNRLSPGWRYGLWCLLVARLVLPASLESGLSIFNVVKLQRAQRTEATQGMPVTQAIQATEFPGDSGRLPGTPVVSGNSSPAPNSQLSTPSSQHQSPLPRSEPPAIAPQPAREVLHLGSWETAAIIWLFGVLIFGVRLLWVNLRFRARLRAFEPISDHPSLGVLEECRAALRVRQRVELIESDLVQTPGVYGFWRKRLLVPEGTFERFDRSELRCIFLHELAHLRRRDLEVNWLAALLQVLYWFNPVIWFAFGRMRADRELATDALALSVAAPTQVTLYGETIIRVLEGFSGRPALPGVVGIAENLSHIKQRMKAIAQFGAIKHWKWLAAAAALAVGLVTLTDAQQSVNTRTQSQTAGGASSTIDQGQAPPASAQSNLKWLRLKVIDLDSSAPLSGAVVNFQFKRYGQLPTTKEVGTGLDGVATIEFAPGDLERFSYSATLANYISPEGEWTKQIIGSIPGELEFRLSRGTEVGGVVVDGKGTPVAGAEIVFNRRHSMILNTDESNPAFTLYWRTGRGDRIAVTDDAGVWRSRSFYGTITFAELGVRHRNFADATYSTRITKAMEAQGDGHPVAFDELTSKTAKFVMETGISVAGKVVDENGRPVPSVAVRYASQPNENPYIYDLMGRGSLQTDSVGNFQIPHLTAKHLFLAAQAPGFAPTMRELELSNSVSGVELVLKRGQILSGRVVDNSNQPLPGVTVSFMDWSIWQGVEWNTTKDGEGRFRWNDAPSERFRLRFEQEGFINRQANIPVSAAGGGRPETSRAPIEAGFSLVGGGEQVVRLNPTLKLSGQLLDAVSKQIVHDYRILWATHNDDFAGARLREIQGSNGVYTLDLGKLHSKSWSDGYAGLFVFRVEAEGHLPFVSREFSSAKGDVGAMTYDVELTPVAPWTGVVLDSAGAPVKSAQVAPKIPSLRLRLAGKPRFENLDLHSFPLTDSDGRFSLTPDPEATYLVAVHEQGIAWVPAKDLKTNMVIRLQKWGTIEGTIWENGKVLANESVWHGASLLPDGGRYSGFDFFVLRGASDDQGRFRFNYVPPGEHSFYRMIKRGPGESVSGPASKVDLREGETASIRIGGIGRPVIGRIVIKNPYVLIDWQKSNFPRIHTVFPKRPVDLKTPEEFEAWQQKDEVKNAFAAIRNHPINFENDGSFRISEVIPGRYQFQINLHDPRDPDAFAYSRYIARFSQEFEVPATAEQNSEIPFDIGLFEMSLNPRLEDAKPPAPDFKALGMDSKELTLAGFRGKYVLIDFWATWCAPCIGDLPYLREVQKKYGARNDFVMISLSVDKTLAEPKAFVEKNDMPWTQAYLGDWTASEVPRNYGVEGIPAMFLVDPEGRLIAKDFSANTLVSELASWLK